MSAIAWAWLIIATLLLIVDYRQWHLNAFNRGYDYVASTLLKNPKARFGLEEEASEYGEFERGMREALDDYARRLQ